MICVQETAITHVANNKEGYRLKYPEPDCLHCIYMSIIASIYLTVPTIVYNDWLDFICSNVINTNIFSNEKGETI